MKNFALIGVGGYVAVRHLRAIKETGNEGTDHVDPRNAHRGIECVRRRRPAPSPRYRLAG